MVPRPVLATKLVLPGQFWLPILVPPDQYKWSPDLAAKYGPPIHLTSLALVYIGDTAVSLMCEGTCLICLYNYTRYRDASTGRHYWAKVAFKTRIYPTSYQVLPQTVLPTTGRQIDKYFDNSELEWSTKERGAVILYGLLVKLTAVDGGT